MSGHASGQNNHDNAFVLSLSVDIVIKVIADSTPITFLAIYSAITISLCFIGSVFIIWI